MLVMVALPAVLVLLKIRLPLLVMAALPAVLGVAEIQRAAAMLVMVALPAVLVVVEFQAAVVGDGGAAGAAGVVELQDAVVGDGGAAGRAGVDEMPVAPPLLVMVALPAVLVSVEMPGCAAVV